MADIGNKINTLTTSGNVEVEESSTKVLEANENRLGTQFVNASTASIYLGLGKAAETKKGIFLAANGSWDGRIGPMVWTGTVFAIASAAKSILTVIEL